MRLRTPSAPDERGNHDGRPWWLWKGSGTGPWPAMIILHGADSGKENHADFARVAAGRGWLALTYDARGHGESEDEMSPAALADVGRMASMLAARDDVDAGRICVRGSSMGGWFAIHAAATIDLVKGVIAICPAGEDLLRRGIRNGTFQMRVDRDSMDAWLGEHDLADSIRELSGSPLIILHAQGDDRVPWTDSERLFSHATEPRKLLIVPGGSHRSVQHDPELQIESLRWLERALGQ